VFVVKATGEVFRTYEAYLKQMELYRQAVWSCRYSGKGGLALEEAQEAERKAVAALQAVSREQGVKHSSAASLPVVVFFCSK
jgi:hypothetical protein